MRSAEVVETGTDDSCFIDTAALGNVATLTWGMRLWVVPTLILAHPVRNAWNR